MLLLIYFGVFTLACALLFLWLNPRLRVWAILVAFAIAFSLALFSTVNINWMLANPFNLWLYTLPLFPFVSLLLKGANMFSRFSKPKSQQEQLADWERREAARQARLSRRAAGRREAAGSTASIRLGSRIDIGDVFPPELGVTEEDGWVLLDERLLDQHMFVLGTTGAGKSETIKRIVFEVLRNTDRYIYVVDGKGDEQLANEIRSLAFHHNRGQAPVFRLGFDQSGAIYDGFRGQPTDIYNRLCALVGVADAEGNAEFYADVNRDILQMICYAPEGPPRSFEELRARLSRSWLKAAYSSDLDESEAIEELTDTYFKGLVHRIRPLVREFARSVGDGGFALEETPAAIFSLRAQSVGDTARRFLDFFIEDLKDFIGKRQEHPAVLIIDEFGQFDNQNITALLSLARSSKLAIILATQDVASMKDERTKRLVLANTRTKLLMASEFPEDIAKLAGTIFQFEASQQFQDGEATGMGSARSQHAFKIDMNEAAKLAPGEAFLIRQRHVAKILVRQIEEVTLIPGQEEQKRPVKMPRPKPKKKKNKKRPRSLE